LRRAGGAA